MSELVDKQVNVQKESLKNFRGSRKTPASPRRMCDENERNKEKNDGRLKYFLMEEGVYKARAENSCHGYQTTLGQRFFIVSHSQTLVIDRVARL